jgi:SAM-dependent methyltransferase
MPGKLRINIGCGATPTPGWINLDNSLTVRLAKVPGLPEFLRRLHMIGPEQLEFARVVRQHGVHKADAVRRIPFPDSSAEVVYSSHMIEHLDPAAEVPRFLHEARRVLIPGGILRLVVPDLGRRVRRYLATGDADEFLASLHMADGTPRGVVASARFVIAGVRNHRWMYDAASLMRLLERHGFRNAKELSPGETTIPDPGALNLREREEESVYVEAKR